MATTKVSPDPVLDAALAYIAAADEMYVCSGASSPGTRAAAIAAALITVAMTPNSGNGDYLIADESISPYGRKLTMTAKNAQSIAVTGDATCIALCKLSDTTLRYVTTVTTQTLTNGGTADIPSWKISLGDPA
jgi:hypothetical protein